jgi:hypothetical protein
VPVRQVRHQVCRQPSQLLLAGFFSGAPLRRRPGGGNPRCARVAPTAHARSYWPMPLPAIFAPRRSLTAPIQRLRGSRLRAAKRSARRAPWISNVRKYRSPRLLILNPRDLSISIQSFFLPCPKPADKKTHCDDSKEYPNGRQLAGQIAPECEQYSAAPISGINPNFRENGANIRPNSSRFSAIFFFHETHPASGDLASPVQRGYTAE